MSLVCFVTQVLSTLRSSAPGARKGSPNSLPRFACADLAVLATHCVRVGDTPPLAFAALAGVGQGQGVFVSKHSTAIQNGGTTHEHQRQHHRNRYQPEP